jgi:hypothetical protein
MNPKTPAEWAAYISGLDGEALWSKAIAANTHAFVQNLQEEGTPSAEIVDVLLLFGLQLEMDGQALPTDMPGQYLSYPALLKSAGR